MLLGGAACVGLGCSGRSSDPNGDGGAEASVAVTLTTDSASCASQRAQVPRSGAVSATVTGTPETTQRTASAAYVAYEVNTSDAVLYLSFSADLPTSFSTEQARVAFQYAYVGYGLRQPAAFGGSLTLLSTSELLELSDFERFEVSDGALSWRLSRTSAEHYSKQLSTYDADPSNAPPSSEACLTDDIQGVCYCDFAGPAIRVTLDGSVPE